MASLADRTIEAHNDTHRRLVKLVNGLSDDDLRRPSGAAEWSVADALSHLGSGAELHLANLRAAQGDEREREPNQDVWDRWNARSPREQADAFLIAAEAVVVAYEALTDADRERLRVSLSWLPEPVDMALFTGMRLHELALHGWDVEVAFDDNAALAPEAAAVMLEHLRGGYSFLLRFAAKTAALHGASATLRVEATEPERTFGLMLDDGARLDDAPDDPTGVLTLPLESFLRLLAGRLTPAHTPAGASLTGAVSLDVLRGVFAGY
jgi:uncharacterized protein (TIGR03083 family)